MTYLFYCLYVQECWKEAIMPNIIYHYADISDSFVDWLFEVLTEVRNVDVGKLAMIL